MEIKCPICNSYSPESSSSCKKCGWRLSFVDEIVLDNETKTEILSWAKYYYEQFVLSKTESNHQAKTPIFTNTRSNVQLFEHSQEIKDLKSELKTLTNGMKEIAGEQDTERLSIKLSECFKLLFKLFLNEL